MLHKGELLALALARRLASVALCVLALMSYVIRGFLSVFGSPSDPASLSLSAVEDLSRIPGVQSVHELHVWELARDRNVASLHVKCSVDASSFGLLSYRVREVFHRAGVHSVTVQPEFGESGDGSLCSAPCLSADCRSRLCCPGPAAPLSVCNGHPPAATGPAAALNTPPKGEREALTKTEGKETNGVVLRTKGNSEVV